MAGRVVEVELTLPEPPRGRGQGKKRKKASDPVRLEASDAPVLVDPALLGALRRWRREESARRGVPAYVVLHDRTLEALAAARPSNLGALSAISGIGPAKLAAYGPALLSLLASR
jgi:superfamily II DNA helicase RecQ